MIKTAIAYGLGCLLFFQFATIPTINWVGWVLFNSFLFLFQPTRLIAIVLAGGSMTLWHSQQHLADQLPLSAANKVYTVTGVVQSIPDKHDRFIRFTLNQSDPTLPKQIRLNWYSPFPETLRSGQQWQLSVKLKPPLGMANPAGFDYERWLFQNKIGATGYVKSNSDNHLISEPAFFHINAYRQRLNNTLSHLLPQQDYLGLIKGLITGVRHDISTEQWEILTHTGTNHLLAISGLHIGLAATIGFFIFSRLWSIRAKNLLYLPAQKVGAMGSILFACYYAALAGFSIPTQRALIMVITIMLAEFSHQPIAIRHRLALAVFLILLMDPLSVLSPGFYLSFAAVAIILFMSQGRRPKPKGQALSIHFYITIGLSPFLIAFFHETALIAPLANLIAVPFVSLLIIPILFLAITTLPLSQNIGQCLLEIAHQGLEGLMSFLGILGQTPFSQWQTHHLTPAMLAAVMLATVILLVPKNWPFKWLALIGTLPLISSAPDSKLAEGEMKLVLFDVGQGLAAIIETKHHRLLFDTGPKFSNRFNTGEAVLLPYLKQQPSSTIDALIISHSDNDHRGGAEFLIKNTNIKKVISSQPHYLSNSEPCLAGQSWQWDGIRFEFLNPQPKQKDSDNNLSCVLKVTHREHSILLTGDIEKKIERKLTQQYGTALQSSIVIAPHHGSNTSSSAAFIQAVKPDLVLFPAAFLNRYNFPDKEVIQRYEKAGATPLSTATSGAITLTLRPHHAIQIHRQRRDAKKIWTPSFTE